jgi:hypothetical protein
MAKVMTYEDIVYAERKRAAKEAIAPGAKRGSRRPQNSESDEGKRSRADELELGKREMAALGLEEYCSILQ